MRRWALVCSVDAVDIDYETEIESEDEPDFWDCQTIATEHCCDWWYCEPLDD